MQRAYDYTIRTQKLYKEECKKNDDLGKQWDLRFNNQQKYIDAIIKIVKVKRETLFDDVESLIRDGNKFMVESLMIYSFYK